jgi:hypothetical protein
MANEPEDMIMPMLREMRGEMREMRSEMHEMKQQYDPAGADRGYDDVKIRHRRF